MKTILIVEDDQKYRSLIRSKLETTGFSVLEASNGEEALEVLRKQAATISLILLDMVMPEMDGMTFYYHFKKSLAAEKPVIILTNLSTSSYPSEIHDFIVKTDISLDQLVEKIKQYIP